MNDDDATLIARVAQGDQDALRELYLRFFPRVWRYLRDQCAGDDGRAEELTQEVFLAVWRSAERFRGASSVATWIFRIAHLEALQARRNLQRRSLGDLVPLDDEADQFAAPDDAVADRLDLEAALTQLPLKLRETLTLVVLQGFSVDEAAQILDIPAGTVKSRLSNARRALARSLNPAEEPRP